MTRDLQVQVTEDWQRDAIVLVPYRHSEGGTQVGTIIPSGQYDAAPTMRLVGVPPAEVADISDPPGLAIQVDLARALYDALGRHFGEHRDPASRELVSELKERATVESMRVDRLVDVLVECAMPRTWTPAQ